MGVSKISVIVILFSFHSVLSSHLPKNDSIVHEQSHTKGSEEMTWNKLPAPNSFKPPTVPGVTTFEWHQFRSKRALPPLSFMKRPSKDNPIQISSNDVTKEILLPKRNTLPPEDGPIYRFFKPLKPIANNIVQNISKTFLHQATASRISNDDEEREEKQIEEDIPKNRKNPENQIECEEKKMGCQEVLEHQSPVKRAMDSFSSRMTDTISTLLEKLSLNFNNTIGTIIPYISNGVRLIMQYISSWSKGI